MTGIWGSAFTILLQRVLHEGKPPDSTITNMRNTGDLRRELRMYLVINYFGLEEVRLTFSFGQKALDRNLFKTFFSAHFRRRMPFH